MATDVMMSGSTQNGPWCLDIESTELAVTVANGVAALTGRVRCVLDPTLTGGDDGRAAKTIDNHLQVLVPLVFNRHDVQIACAVAAAVRRALPGSCEYARFTIQDGRVRIEGELQWNYQRERFEEAIAGVAGITCVSDRTTLNPHVDLNHVRGRIRQALSVNAAPSDDGSAVNADRGESFHGTLHSWAVRGRIEPSV